jgi:Protein of unknown function (DUF4236)
MGFYIRKGIRVGPLRFNLSNSGVGISTGIKGFRISSGPRGNYVNIGRGGLYYRAAIPSPKSRPAPEVVEPKYVDPVIPDGTHDPLLKLQQENISKIVDSSSKELLDEMNEKRRKIRFWPIVSVVFLAAMLYGFSQNWHPYALVALLVLISVVTYATYVYDELRKSVVLFYEFDEGMERLYEKAHDAGEILSQAASIWFIDATGKVRDRKYHAGASQLVERKTASIKKLSPPYVKTNIEVLSFVCGDQTLYFFPERVLVYGQDGIGAVSYSDLDLEVGIKRFIEEDGVPRDAKVVDKTWKYVNKGGGPDKRFKDNRELPICQYEEIAISSQTGLNKLLQLSRLGFGDLFSTSIKELGKGLPKENTAAILKT